MRIGARRGHGKAIVAPRASSRRCCGACSPAAKDYADRQPSLTAKKLRFNKEIGRRTDVVGIFPDDQSLIRLAGMLWIEQNNEWLVGRGYLSAQSISLVLAGPDDHIDKKIKEEVTQLHAA